MGRSVRVPRVRVGGSVLTGNTWNNGIAPKLEGLRTLGNAGVTERATGIGVLGSPRTRGAKFLPWEFFVDVNANRLTVWPRGAYVIGPALDDEDLSETDKATAALYPSRLGHPWVPKIGGAYIDRRNSGGLYPTLVCSSGVVTYVWCHVSLNQRRVPFGDDFKEDPEDDANYAVAVVGRTASELTDAGGGEITTTEETSNGAGTEHTHDVELEDLRGALDEFKLRTPLQMLTYDVGDVSLITSTSAHPQEELDEKYYLVGLVDRRGSGKPITRVFWSGPVTVATPVLVGSAATDTTDPDGGLVDGQGPLEPRGLWGDDADNSGRGGAPS